jgi:hypothetical protein
MKDNHKHDWKVLPESSNRTIIRYKCECGAYGWRTMYDINQSREIKIYKSKWEPRKELTVKDRIIGHGPDKFESSE